MNDQQLASFVRGLPKAELHLHIEGTFEPELMFQIGQRNGCQMRFDSVQALKAAYEFDNLQSFLDIYYEGAGVLIHEVDFYDLTWAYLCRAHEDSVRHVELFFDPQTHTERGVAFETVLDGIERACLAAQQQFGMSFELICCFLRHLSADEAMVTLEQARVHKDRIKAVGLDSSEVGHPPSKFQGVFDRARALGFLTVAHAGEEGPPGYIVEALDLLGVQRIDHGVRAIEDDALVRRLAQEEIALTVCPLSNTALKVFDDLSQHTLGRLHAAGVKITLNSDDPSYFGGYINDNFLATARALSLDASVLAEFAKNSFQYSFASDDRKAQCLAELKTYLSQ